MLKAVDLTLWRGLNCLFEDLSFEVPPGVVQLVRGPNGSGKTTLLRVLCGLTRPETGRVEWAGEPIEANRQAYGARLAYCGHSTGLKADLTVIQNLIFAARLQGQDGRPWERIVEPLALGRCADLQVRYLSAGQKRRTGLARMLMSGAEVWVMDEPFTNLDRHGRAYLSDQLSGHLESGGLAVVAAHHDLDLGAARMRSLTLGAVV